MAGRYEGERGTGHKGKRKCVIEGARGQKEAAGQTECLRTWTDMLVIFSSFANLCARSALWDPAKVTRADVGDGSTMYLPRLPPPSLAACLFLPPPFPLWHNFSRQDETGTLEALRSLCLSLSLGSRSLCSEKCSLIKLSWQMEDVQQSTHLPQERCQDMPSSGVGVWGGKIWSCGVIFHSWAIC